MIKRKIFKYAMPISVIMSLCLVSPTKDVSAATNSYVPQVNAYQLNGHAKIELGIDMADEDIIKKEGFESGETLPSLTWQPFNGNQSFSNDTSYSGSVSEKLTNNIDGLKGNFYSYPNQNSPNSYTSFPDKVQKPANGSWFSVSFKVKAVSGSINNIDFMGIAGHKSGGNLMTDNRGNQILYRNVTSWQNGSPNTIQVYSNVGTVYLDDGGTYILLSSTSNNYDWGYSYYTWNQAQQSFTWQPNGGNINPCAWQVARPSSLTTKKDVFSAGSSMITYPGNADLYFSPRSIDGDSQWKTFSMNAQLPNDPKYNYSTQGFIPSFYWSTNGTMYIDDIKFGYASQSNIYRNGQLIHSGYDSDFEDIQAIDTAKPNVPANVSMTEVSSNLTTQWSASADNGTTYNYTANSVSNRTGAVSATSAPVPVTVTTGIKGYSVVVDNNPTTDPGNNVNTTNPSFSSPLGNIDISQPMYIHVKAIDNAGNVSDTIHYQYNYVNYSNALNSVIDAENNKTQTKVDYAQMLINTLPSCGRKTDLQNRLNVVQTYVTNVSNATKAVVKTEIDKFNVFSTTLQTEVNTAQSLINLLQSDATRTDLQNRLNAIQQYINDLVNATNALVKAEESKSITDVNIAQPLITALPSCPEKPILQNRLDVLKQYIVAESAVSIAEEVSTQANIDKAQTLVDALPVGSNKTYLQNRIDTIKNNILAMGKAKEAVKKAQQTYLQADLNNAQSLVSVLPDGLVKIDLQTTLDGIQDYINTMLRVSAAVEKAESTKNIIDVDNAQNEINNLLFGTFRTDLQNRLDVVKAYLKTISDATSAVEKAESTFSQTDVNNARNLVGDLTDITIKTDLTNRLDAVQKQINKVNTIVDAVGKLESDCSQVDLDNARNLVNTLEDGSLKTSLLDRLDKIQAYIDKVANATKAVDKAETSKTTDDINNAQSLIDILPEGDSNKIALQKRLDAIQQSVKAVSDLEKYVVKAEVSKLQVDIDVAQSKINTLPDGVEKTNLQNRLDAVKQYISNVTYDTNVVIKAESSRSLTDINNAQDLINKLPDGATKTDLQNRLNAIKNIYNLIQNTTDAVNKAEGSMSQIDIDNAQAMINKLPDGPEKTELQNRLDQLKAKLSALANATAAVEKAEGSKLKVDVDAAQALVNVLPLGIDRTNLQKRLDAIVENTNAVANYTGLVEKAEKTKLQSDVTIAQNAVNTLPLGSDRYYLQCRLDAVQQYINDLATATAAVEKAESTKNQFDINAARTLVDLLSDGADKTNLKNRLDAIQNYLNNKSSALDAVLKAEKSGLQSDIDIALALVNQMPDGPEKTELLNRLNALQGKADNITKVIDAIEKAEKSGLQSDIDVALALMNQYNISNSSIKSRIDVIQKYINDLDLATAAVEKAERTKLQTDKNYAAPLVKAINDNLYAAKKANLSSRLDVVQNYINQLNDSTYGVVKSEITKTEQDATNAQTPIDKLPSATSENNIQDKINVPSTGTTDKDVLQDGLNNTTSYLEALNVATQAVVKAETSLSQADKNYAQNLADKLSIPSSNLQTRLSVVQKQIDAIAGATSMVELAENSKSQTDLNKAKTAVNSLVSCTQKTDLLSRVDVVQKYINDCKDATYLVSKAEISKNSTDIANAQTAVSNLADGTDKANLQGRLDMLKNKNTPTTTTSGLETATTAVEKAEGSYLLTDYNAAQTLVTSLSSSSDKTKLQSRLTNVKKVITQISTATTAVVSAEKYKTQTYISKAQTLVSAIVDCSQKNDLQNRLNSIQVK